MDPNNSENVPATETIFGWKEVKIIKATKCLARSGQSKLLMHLEITAPTEIGQVVNGHLPLGDTPRAKALIKSFKNALKLPETSSLPNVEDLVSRELRVRISPWLGNDGLTRESVSAFAPPPQVFAAEDKEIFLEAPLPDNPPF